MKKTISKKHLNANKQSNQIEKLLGKTIISYGDTIHSAIRMTIGIDGWYGAYITSDEFKASSIDLKKKSFENI